jgi:hypothetical protein
MEQGEAVKRSIQIPKYLFLFVLGFVLYIAIEICATGVDHTIKKQFGIDTQFASLIGFSSVWMGVTGGILFVILSGLLQVKKIDALPVALKALVGAGLITAIEFTSGCVLNLWLKFGIWNYGGLNILGQIDLFHSIAWFFLAPFVIWARDTFLYFFYGEGDHDYSLLWIYVHLIFPWRKMEVADQYNSYLFSRAAGQGVIKSFRSGFNRR